jgi:methyltransferase-like protein 6
VFPILERLKNPDLTVFCCDFSPNAVGLVKSCKDYDGGQRCTPFVLDATKDNWEDEADMPLKPESLGL